MHSHAVVLTAAHLVNVAVTLTLKDGLQTAIVVIMGWSNLLVVFVHAACLLVTPPRAVVGKLCTPDYCSNVTCKPIKASECDGEVEPKASDCGCCDQCVKQIDEGDVCFSFTKYGLRKWAECKKGLKCNETTFSCGSSSSKIAAADQRFSSRGSESSPQPPPHQSQASGSNSMSAPSAIHSEPSNKASRTVEEAASAAASATEACGDDTGDVQYCDPLDIGQATVAPRLLRAEEQRTKSSPLAHATPAAVSAVRQRDGPPAAHLRDGLRLACQAASSGPGLGPNGPEHCPTPSWAAAATACRPPRRGTVVVLVFGSFTCTGSQGRHNGAAFIAGCLLPGASNAAGEQCQHFGIF
ncbi:hypothetical protein HPB49_024234 [Dermacentor silvarum]|uniref:Uncharacterized protein n=1 Tax=Dermacentor silvarum TaxID=543639 RepID=A0ACB8DLY9_DERSI|nr:hypothetical protein HPB49_024234 [Dermacentor silvarum]